MTNERIEDLLRCTFCGKSQKEVAKLIAGPSVFICDECVGLCNEILEEEGPPPKRVKLPRDATDLSTDELRSHLRSASSITADLDQRLKTSVDVLRERGHTWTQIGEALGVSRQAAWERFSGDV